jgi:hypothetical protein
MVAEKWGWSTPFMASVFGWKAACAVFINGLLLTVFFKKELLSLQADKPDENQESIPLSVVFMHLAFMAATVVFAHYPVVFIGLFLFFLGFTEAYQRYQDRLMLREVCW